ncbi:YchJ family protein [Carboxylicivirga sp. M1479]|uniref:YchJ family protein n=1 Tax=Carboxylicivirga sp. M1479 TaxID=2594476 RepID=UPI001178478A|nr:YchJ family metal-binding protein [Carboxylicivirga sp. M1479]TRX61673.1 Sec-C motif domain protein [Carboxylicivirga sp. M1479]
MQCPCQSNNPYTTCCQALIEETSAAPTAEKLMRSRYTAYTLGDIDYLMRTHHVSTRPIKEKNEIKKWTDSVQWMGLSILSKKDGNENDKQGIVEFKAVFIEKGMPNHIHEKSRFVKEKGLWYYKSGQHF